METAAATKGVFSPFGTIFLLIIIAVLFFLLVLTIQYAINRSNFSKEVNQQLRSIKTDLAKINEQLQKKDQE